MMFYEPPRPSQGISVEGTLVAVTFDRYVLPAHMRLKLSIWAEGLDSGSSGSNGRNDARQQHQPNPYGVISVMSPTPGIPPRVLGQTETLRKTSNPDWTKFFVVEDFELGRPYHVSVSVYDDDERNDEDGGSRSPRRLLGAAMFELGQVLGSPGGAMGKECGAGGTRATSAASSSDNAMILVLQVEPSHADLGVFRFQFGAAPATTTNSIPSSSAGWYFELQRLRQSVRTGARVWDCVFRSRIESIGVGNAASPRCWWDESFVELDEVCGGDLHEPFRIAMYEDSTDGSSDPMLKGECRCSVQDLTAKSLGAAGGRASPKALASAGTDRAIVLSGERGTPSGFLWVALAEVSLDKSAPPPTEIPEAERRQRQTNITEGEIYVASPSEELVIDPYSSDAGVEPTFVNFIRGGCQLHVVVAVDATASNGDPRKDASLHCFRPTTGQPNAYERALEALCTLLSQYDSDQQYPVYGFGARPKGATTVSHCFPLHPHQPTVDGVPGILQAYRDAFRSGIVMSSPRDYSAVIESAAAQARAELQKGPQQAYSVLLIFTSGPPVDLNKSIASIRNAEADPLSIVVVGIGDADFAPLQQSLAAAALRRDMVRFVPYRNEGSSSYALTSAALDPIPSQLESYFAGRGIRPNPPVAPDEIVVEPYRPEPSLVYQVPMAGAAATAVAASPTSSYVGTSVPVVAGSVYVPNAAASPAGTVSVPVATAVSPVPAPSSSYAAPATVPVATGVPVHSTSASPPPFNASLATPLASPAPHAAGGGGAGHSNNTNPNNNNDNMKGMGKKLLNRVGKHAVGRLKGEARAKINHFTRQKIGFGIL